MKIISTNPTLLTNPEALVVLKERQASTTHGKEPQASDLEVIRSLEHLYSTTALNREQIQGFVAIIQENYNISKYEVLQLINHKPTSILEAYLCLEQAINSGRIQEDDLDQIVVVVAEKLGVNPSQ